MNKLFLIIAMFFTACAASEKQDIKNKQAREVADSSIVPACVIHLIDSFKNEPVQNPPRKIFSYTYKSNTVYYITSPCCDQYNVLIDANCNILGHPDGGFSGGGDGKVPDFATTKENEKLIWQDERK